MTPGPVTPRPVSTSRPLALVAGGSRGLGLAAAYRLAERGHDLVLCARDRTELDQAAAQLRRTHPEGSVEVAVCDVTDRQAISDLVTRLEARPGGIEVLLHVAGIIQVGPLACTTHDHFAQAVDVMLWGPIHTTRAVVPAMVSRGHGRIGVVTSVGGLVAVPHLLPYSTAKFGATGYTRGLRAELAGTGVSVTTAAPGLMRTGSPVNAEFVGDHPAEYAWFATAASLPLLSMDADRAAGRIVDAVLAGRAIVQPTPLALVAPRVDALAPRLTSALLGLTARLLPAAPATAGHDPDDPGVTLTGRQAERQLRPAARRRLHTLTALGRRAADRLNERT